MQILERLREKNIVPCPENPDREVDLHKEPEFIRSFVLYCMQVTGPAKEDSVYFKAPITIFVTRDYEVEVYLYEIEYTSLPRFDDAGIRNKIISEIKNIVYDLLKDSM